MKDLNEYSNKELLQVVLSDGAGHLSETILTYKEGGIRTLNTFNEPFLAHIGVSQGRRERLLCAIELGRRIQAADMQNVLIVNNSASVFEYCKSKLSGLAHVYEKYRKEKVFSGVYPERFNEGNKRGGEYLADYQNRMLIVCRFEGNHNQIAEVFKIYEFVNVAVNHVKQYEQGTEILKRDDDPGAVYQRIIK